MVAKKKRASGGAVLLKTKGNSYFSELAKKGAEKRKKAVELWEKTQAKKTTKKK
jgi:hypothetical protein